MMLQNRDAEFVERDCLFGYTVIDDKITYSYKILKKFQRICKFENYSNITDLFFMITHLQTKYMYDIELQLKRKKHIAIISYKKSYNNLNNILNELKKSHKNNTIYSFRSVLDLYTIWVNEQHKIDIELVNLLNINK